MAPIVVPIGAAGCVQGLLPAHSENNQSCHDAIAVSFPQIGQVLILELDSLVLVPEVRYENL